MSIAVRTGPRVRPLWGLVLASVAVSGLLLAVGGPVTLRVAEAGMAVIAATCMAVGDARTGKLRNAWTGPFAAAATLHLAFAVTLDRHAWNIATTALLALLVNGGVYLAMGFAGWVGFGDVKFVIGLTLFAVALAGSASMLLPVIALLIAALLHVFPTCDQQRSSRPHGPALSIAFALILAGSGLA